MEVGTYGLFLQAFRDLFGYSKVEGTTFENPGDTAKSIQRSFDFDPEGERFTLYDMNLENTQIPVDDQSFDFVLAAEVIEHFSTDPNFFFFEANRILKHGGRLLITTPNVVCSENVFRILWRQVPHRILLLPQRQIHRQTQSGIRSGFAQARHRECRPRCGAHVV